MTDMSFSLTGQQVDEVRMLATGHLGRTSLTSPVDLRRRSNWCVCVLGFFCGVQREPFSSNHNHFIQRAASMGLS